MTSPLTSTNERSLLAAAVALAERAGVAILEVYAGDIHVAQKPDYTPVTEADLRAHRLIVDGLTSLTPELPVLSEESSDVPLSERVRWRRYWLVDPLDGTREFIARNGEFTVNIALMDDEMPVLGVVHVPAQGRTYSGARGAGATLATIKGSSTIHVAVPAHNPVRVVGSRSHRGGSLDAYLAALGPHTFVPAGSALKFCTVAEGAADLYPRFGPTSQWDTAAGQAIVEAAGGQVLDLAGRPFRYPARADHLNPHFVVIGDGGHDWLAASRKGAVP